MASIAIDYPHSLSAQDALAKAGEVIARLQQEHGAQGQWQGSVFHLTAPARGTVSVLAGVVQVRADLGFAASMFKGKIEATILAELRAAFG